MSRKAITYSKKICLLGTFGVGKTSLVRRFVNDLFDDTYLSTIGVQIYQKELSEIQAKENLKLIVWDLANIEKFTTTIKNYFQGAAGAIVVTDLTRTESYNKKHLYLNQFLEINPKASLIFAGNKIDLIDSNNAPESLVKLAENYKSPYSITSAKTGSNVKAVFEILGKKILECS